MARHVSRTVAALALGFAGMPGCAHAADTAPQAAAKSAADAQPVAYAEPTRPGLDWPCFLGPEGNCISQETGIADKWPETGPPIVWEKKIGSGYSAPSVRGNRLVIHHRQGNDEIVECLRADNGGHLWQFAYPSSFEDPYGYNNGPRCAPLLTENRCYTFGAEGKLVCLDLQSGRKIWMRRRQSRVQSARLVFRRRLHADSRRGFAHHAGRRPA